MTEPSNAEYIVRLVMRVQTTGGTPEEATRNFVELMVENGLREWVYRVEDLDGVVLGYYDGFGQEVDIDAARAAAADDGDDDEPGTTVETVPDEAELLSLAESLNAGEPPSAPA